MLIGARISIVRFSIGSFFLPYSVDQRVFGRWRCRVFLLSLCVEVATQIHYGSLVRCLVS